MSGRQISCVLRYGVKEDGSFEMTRSLIWPILRTIPNNTHASLTHHYDDGPPTMVTVNGQPIPAETVQEITIDGFLHVFSQAGKDIRLSRHFFPSTKAPIYYV